MSWGTFGWTGGIDDQDITGNMAEARWLLDNRQYSYSFVPLSRDVLQTSQSQDTGQANSRGGPAGSCKLSICPRMIVHVAFALMSMIAQILPSRFHATQAMFSTPRASPDGPQNTPMDLIKYNVPCVADRWIYTRSNWRWRTMYGQHHGPIKIWRLLYSNDHQICRLGLRHLLCRSVCLITAW